MKVFFIRPPLAPVAFFYFDGAFSVVDDSNFGLYFQPIIILDTVRYVTAVQYNHVSAFLPYISEAGTLPPESCIFALFLNIMAVFLCLSAYLRHRQFIVFFWEGSRWQTLSTVVLWVAYISALGASIVANFQVHNTPNIHHVGAAVAFVLGYVYTVFQTVFSYMMHSRKSTAFMCHFRLVLNLLSTLFIGIVIVCVPISRPPKEYNVSKAGHVYPWSLKDEMYREHIMAVISEWGLAICIEIYVLSFAFELRNAEYVALELRINGVETRSRGKQNDFESSSIADDDDSEE